MGGAYTFKWMDSKDIYQDRAGFGNYRVKWEKRGKN